MRTPEFRRIASAALLATAGAGTALIATGAADYRLNTEPAMVRAMENNHISFQTVYETTAIKDQYDKDFIVGEVGGILNSIAFWGLIGLISYQLDKLREANS